MFWLFVTPGTQRVYNVTYRENKESGGSEAVTIKKISAPYNG